MRGHQPRYVDSITIIALVLMAVSGAMAIGRYMAPQPMADLQFETVRY
jgi:hypothetical protein